MQDPENKVNKLASMLGGKSVLAEACGLGRSSVSQWVRRGRISHRYIKTIHAFILEKSMSIDVVDRKAWVRIAISCIDVGEECPCCGQILGKGLEVE